MATRKEVYKAIDGERAYQDRINPRKMSVGEEILLAREYLDRAQKKWTEDFSDPEQEALAALRKVAGICVRALERHGAPKRR